MDRKKPVLGHTCEGMSLFQIIGTHFRCVPKIDPDLGRVSGCDAENPIPIQFCPWCGEKLPRAIGIPTLEEVAKDEWYAEELLTP